jgi:hypothetical protein
VGARRDEHRQFGQAAGAGAAPLSMASSSPLTASIAAASIPAARAPSSEAAARHSRQPLVSWAMAAMRPPSSATCMRTRSPHSGLFSFASPVAFSSWPWPWAAWANCLMASW